MAKEFINYDNALVGVAPAHGIGLAEVKNFLGYVSNEKDATLSLLLGSAYAQMERQINGPILLTQYKATHAPVYPRTFGKLAIPKLPVQRFVEVQAKAVGARQRVLTSNEYEAHAGPNAWIDFGGRVWEVISFIYEAGYPTMPAPIKEAIFLTVRNTFKGVPDGASAELALARIQSYKRAPYHAQPH